MGRRGGGRGGNEKKMRKESKQTKGLLLAGAVDAGDREVGQGGLLTVEERILVGQPERVLPTHNLHQQLSGQ